MQALPSKHIQRIRDLTAWVVSGEVAGAIVSLSIPDGSVPDFFIANACGAFFGALGALRIFRNAGDKPAEDLQKDLLEIDKLFLKGTITEEERTMLRVNRLKNYPYQS